MGPQSSQLCGPDESVLARSVNPDNWYLQGIRRAELNGLIHYARPDAGGRSVALDDYSHIDDDGTPLQLKFTNTRPLSAMARHILDLYRTSGSSVRFLELGPGAGVACATASRLLADARIDTISLTPLNPYLRFRSDDIYDRITEPLSDASCLELYSSCRHPFVQSQYIGKFPREVTLPSQGYHFIYENYGAIFWNLLVDGGSDLTELARVSIASALSLLRSDGTMLIMASDGSHRVEDAIESNTVPTDVVVICKPTTAWHNYPCIVARHDSPLAIRLRTVEPQLLPGSERILRLESQTLDELIARLCLVA